MERASITPVCRVCRNEGYVYNGRSIYADPLMLKKRIVMGEGAGILILEDLEHAEKEELT